MADLQNVADKKQTALSPEQRQKIIKEILSGQETFQTLANDKLYTLMSVYTTQPDGTKSLHGYSLAGGVKDVFIFSPSGQLYSVNQDLCYNGKCSAKEPVADQVLLDLQKVAKEERSGAPQKKPEQKKSPEQQRKPRYSPEQKRIAVLYAESIREKESDKS